MTKSKAAIRELVRAAQDGTGNLPPLAGVFPYFGAPVVREGADGRELVVARCGMPSPQFALKGRKVDPGVTDIRNAASPHWRRLARTGTQVLGAVHIQRRLAAFSGGRMSGSGLSALDPGRYRDVVIFRVGDAAWRQVLFASPGQIATRTLPS